MQQLQIPPLAEGEVYVGALGDKNGDVYHVILLPGDNNAASWQDQMAWAKSIGGDLLTRAELVIAYEKHRDQFKKAFAEGLVCAAFERDRDQSKYLMFEKESI